MTLTREQQQGGEEDAGMESLRAHADARRTLLPPPPPAGAEAGSDRKSSSDGGVGAFECRTCSRRFPSFQALGGHRTGHTRLQARHGGAELYTGAKHKLQARAHECAVCGLEFPVGQALGGHMRRHKAEAPAPAERRVEEMLDLNYPAPLEDRGGDQEEFPGPELRLLNLLV